jgi:1-pyrroline-5-carboxylate dehydrogenase
VLKPSPQSGLTAAFLMETADAASLPPGVLNLIKGEEAGPLLVDAEGVDSIAITGSHQAGMRIFRKMASSPMHGHSLRLRAFGRGMLGLLGRLCRRTRGRRILKRLKARAEAIAIGNPEERQTFMGPVINAAAVERFHKAVKAARSKGRIVHGGEALADTIMARGTSLLRPSSRNFPGTTGLTKSNSFCRFSRFWAAPRWLRVSRGDIAMFMGCARDSMPRIPRRSSPARKRASSTSTGGRAPRRELGVQSFCGWKGSGGGLGPFTIPRYMREQSLTIMRG